MEAEGEKQINGEKRGCNNFLFKEVTIESISMTFDLGMIREVCIRLTGGREILIPWLKRRRSRGYGLCYGSLERRRMLRGAMTKS